jgi:hypothetical protein
MNKMLLYVLIGKEKWLSQFVLMQKGHAKIKKNKESLLLWYILLPEMDPMKHSNVL